MNPPPPTSSSLPAGAQFGLAPRDVEMIGLLSGVVFAVSLVPQIHLVIRNRSANDLSYAWLWLEFIAVLISLLYYFLHSAWSALLTGLLEGLAALLLLLLKWYYSRQSQQSSLPRPTFPKDSAVAPAQATHDLPRWRDSRIWMPPEKTVSRAHVDQLALGTLHARRDSSP